MKVGGLTSELATNESVATLSLPLLSEVDVNCNVGEL